MQYEPNVIIPLAPSLNTRGVAGYANSVTSGLDQRRINYVYRPVQNPITGTTTLYLSKRPGISIDPQNKSFGTSGQVAYLNSMGAQLNGGLSDNVWVYSVSGNDVRASNSGGTTTVILTSAGVVPQYVDKTSIGATDTVVLQVGTSFVAQSVWYSTTIGTWTQITDGDFPTITGKMEFMDGYAFAINYSANIQRVHNSDLNSIANWTAGNYITKQIQQDQTTGLMRLGNLIIAGGTETMEVMRNVGNASGSPLETIPQLAQRTGVKPNTGPYYCTINDRIYFYGGAGSNVFIGTFNGAIVERVSTPNIESILNSTTKYSINTIALQGRQAVAISLSAVSDSTQRMLLFFPEYKEWFEWTSTVFCPLNNGYWHLGVGTNQHKLYGMGSTDIYQDEGINFDAVVQFVLPDKGNQRKRMTFCGVKGDTSALTQTVKASDVDGAPSTTLGTIDMSTQLKLITRCGTWKGRRTMSITNSGNYEGRMEAFFARIE